MIVLLRIAEIGIHLELPTVDQPDAGGPLPDIQPAGMGEIESAMECIAGARLHQPLSHAAGGLGAQFEVEGAQFALEHLWFAGAARCQEQAGYDR